MTNKDIEQLINKYLDGETSPAEECQLARELQHTDIPGEWQAISLMLGELTLGEAEYDAIMAHRSNKPVTAPRHIRLWPWFGAIAASIVLLLVFHFTQEPVKKQPVEAVPIVAEAKPQPVPQPVAEEKTENAMAEVQLAPQPARQPDRKRRKAAQGSDDDIQSAPVEEPMPTETEPTIQYQNIQTVHLSSDVVMHIIEASDMPAAPAVPSVSEIRARGLLLTDNVRQASQTTFKF